MSCDLKSNGSALSNIWLWYYTGRGESKETASGIHSPRTAESDKERTGCGER